MLMKFMLIMLFTLFMLSSKLREKRVLQIYCLSFGLVGWYLANYMKSKYFNVKEKQVCFKWKISSLIPNENYVQ